MHSRRAFSHIRQSMQEAKFQAFIWTVRSMKSHRNKVIFALNDCMIGLVTRPRRWPSFKFQIADYTPHFGYSPN